MPVPAQKLHKAAAAFILALAGSLAPTEPALAHGSERGFVLLLPTGWYLAGGALAVAASFLLIALAPAERLDRIARSRLRLFSLPDVSSIPTSLAAFLLLVGLVAAGLYGGRDPLANPLPLTIWTLWWVGLTLVHAVAGNVWTFINPWSGPYRIVRRIASADDRPAPLAYPAWLGYWPAILLFFAFAWFELVDPAPDDPERLAFAVGLYWLIAFAGMLLFGEEAWTARAEPFSIFFRLIGGLSPFVVGDESANGRRDLFLSWPGASLLDRPPLPLSGVLFVLLTLSAVSFDGLSKTFWWLALGDINPLEYPGRTAVMARNTFGLLMSFAALTVAYVTAIRLGCIFAGMRAPLGQAIGTFVYTIVSISIAFHFSHYLTALLVDGQYALIAFSDPFATGHDLLGLGHAHVTTSFLNTYSGVRTIWNLQVAAIVAGHILAVVLAHILATRRLSAPERAAASQVPLAVLMVLYTLFGLWLLSTPVAG